MHRLAEDDQSLCGVVDRADRSLHIPAEIDLIREVLILRRVVMSLDLDELAGTQVILGAGAAVDRDGGGGGFKHESVQVHGAETRDRSGSRHGGARRGARGGSAARSHAGRRALRRGGACAWTGVRGVITRAAPVATASDHGERRENQRGAAEHPARRAQSQLKRKRATTHTNTPPGRLVELTAA